MSLNLERVVFAGLVLAAASAFLLLGADLSIADPSISDRPFYTDP